MSESHVVLTVEDGVATLALNVPDRYNAVTLALFKDGLDALESVKQDSNIRALIFTGNGAAFCAGADLRDILDKEATKPGELSIGEHVAEILEFGANPFVLQLRNLPVPVISAVNGVAAGGGMSLALAGDIVVAAKSAYFVMPFMPALGVVPDAGGAWFLEKAVGRARAFALTLLGERLNAEKAVEYGLIWACYDDVSFRQEVGGLAKRLAELPFHAIVETRKLFDSIERNPLSAQLQYEQERQRVLCDSSAFLEGMNAFREKRKPAFPRA